MNLTITSLPVMNSLVNPTWIKLGDSVLMQRPVTPHEIEDLIIDLLPRLNELAQEDLLFGAWSLDTIFLDKDGRAHLLPGFSMPMLKQFDPNSLFPGFAALEQYTDHPSYPLGPHTDVYGLAMVIRSLILKTPPTPAIERMQQDQEPISAMQIDGFARNVLRSIDHASALEFSQRIPNIQEWAQMLNIIGPASAEMIDRLHAAYVQLLKQQRILLQNFYESKPEFFEPNSAQAEKARSYSASQSPTFVNTYKPRANKGVIVDQQTINAKNIDPPTRTQDQHQRDHTNKIWAQQMKRTGAMVPVSAQNKTVGRAPQTPLPPVRSSNSRGFAVGILSTLLVAVSGFLIYSLFDSHTTSTMVEQTGAVLAQEKAAKQALQRELEQQRAEAKAVATQLEEQRLALEQEATKRKELAAKLQEQERQRQAALTAAKEKQEREQRKQDDARREADRLAQANQRKQEEQARALAAQQRRLEDSRLQSILDTPKTPPATQTPPAVTPQPAVRANSGIVRFNIRPWGNVTINGVNKGPSPPLSTLNLAPGTYAIRIDNGSFPSYNTTITVSAGDHTTISHGFNR